MEKLIWTHNATDGAYHVHQADGLRNCVASVWTVGYPTARESAQQLAKMFAAAPELKAACEGLLVHFVAEYGEDAPQCVDDALAVLAKLKD